MKISKDVFSGVNGHDDSFIHWLWYVIDKKMKRERRDMDESQKKSVSPNYIIGDVPEVNYQQAKVSSIETFVEEFNFDEWLKTASIEELEEYGRPLMEMNKKNNIFSWLTKLFHKKP